MGLTKRLHMAERTNFALTNLRYPDKIKMRPVEVDGVIIPTPTLIKGSEVGDGVKRARARMEVEILARDARLAPKKTKGRKKKNEAVIEVGGKVATMISRQVARHLTRRAEKQPIGMKQQEWHLQPGFAPIKLTAKSQAV